jgi:hypothetical protein
MPFSLPLIGRKVDSIDWAKEEIERTSTALTKSQRVLAHEVNTMTRSSIYSNMPLKELAAELDKQTYPPLNSAFVLFNKQIAAHMATQALAHHEPYQMSSRYIDVSPEDIIWDNLGMNPYEAKSRVAVSYLATAGLVCKLYQLRLTLADLSCRSFFGRSLWLSSVSYPISRSCVLHIRG